jgi:hypothetical protein
MSFDLSRRRPSRRSVLRAGMAAGLASQLALLDQLVLRPTRPRATNAGPFPIIQYAIAPFIAGPVVLNDGAGDVTAQFAPVFSFFVPARLTRTPTPTDQRVLGDALSTIEQLYDFSPSGIFTFVSYGVPYFNRLPGGVNGPLVQRFMPQLLQGRNPDGTTNALAEAVPSPTDVVGGFVGGPGAPVPGVTKDRFNVNVRIEQNDLLFHFRTDSTANFNDVFAWLQGSNSLKGFAEPSPAFNGLLQFQTVRVQFGQFGLPKQVATTAGFEFAPRMNPDSVMWMGFTDQQVDSSAGSTGGPDVQNTTFAGTSTAKLTSANVGDYFGLGAIQHLSHDILDLFQFFAVAGQDPRHLDGEPFTERVMYMFRANQLGTTHGLPSVGNADQFTNGGGPAHIDNVFQGANAAFAGSVGLFQSSQAGGDTTFTPGNQVLTASFTGLPRVGHEAALQRSSRAADGTPLHLRMDGPGFSGLDVPQFEEFPGNGHVFAAGTSMPKLEFTVFVPTAEFFRRMRANAAAQDLQVQGHVDPDDNGLERFTTATRRQNFLVPPRPVRAFPLVEFTAQ